jgi:Flp pilus assembly pilin Flp
MLSLLQTFLHDESGEDLIEYGLLASFVAAVAMATIILDPLGLKPSLVAAYRKAATALYMAAQGDIVQL